MTDLKLVEDYIRIARHSVQKAITRLQKDDTSVAEEELQRILRCLDKAHVELKFGGSDRDPAA